MNKSDSVRPSPIAGTWYNGNPQSLSSQIDGFLTGARDAEIRGRVIGLIVPHAGHRYSGRTAGYAYRTVQSQSPDIVVILSPLHAYYPGILITSAHRAYSTPLGEVEIAEEELQRMEFLLTRQGLRLERILRDEEHSIEIQLPFLQRALKKPFRLLPLMIRSRDEQTLKQVAESLALLLKDKNALLIASTDLSHFFPLEQAEMLDGEMLKRIKAFDPEAVLSAEESGSAAACGAAAIAVVMWAARSLGAEQASILHYSTSADTSGDATSVVGYGAAALTAAPVNA